MTKADRRRAAWKKTNGICAHCGHKVGSNKRTVDHYVPKSKGGGYDARNLIPLCRKCNEARGNANIDPYDYYIFAPKKVITDCLKYETKLEAELITLDGTKVGEY